MSKVVLLSRVSTGQQDLEQQTEQLIKYAKFIGFTDDDLITIEDKESGVKLSEEERNGLNKLKSSILTSGVKDVIVYELSRIARTPSVLYSIRDFLIEHNVQLHCINPSFKLLKPDGSIDESGNVIFSLFCSLAENEGFLRKQRFARGRQKLIDKNLFTGGITPYGYSVNKDKEYIINEDEAKVIRRIFKMYKTMTISDIAKELIGDGTFDKSINSAQCLIRNILHRDYYTGVRTNYNGYKHVDRYFLFPQIIGVPEFREAQEKLKERKKYCKTKSKHKYLCRGLIFNINNEYLRPLHCHNAYAFCKPNKYSWETLSINMNFADSIAWHFTKKAITESPKNLNVIAEESKIELASISYKIKSTNKRIEENEKKLLRIEKRYIDGKISEDTADELKKEVQCKIDMVGRELQQLEARRKELKKYLNNLSDTLRAPVGEKLDELPIDDKIKLVHEQIDKITIVKGDKFYCYMLGIEFKNHDYIIIDVNSQSRKIYDDNGKEIKYQRATPN